MKKSILMIVSILCLSSFIQFAHAQDAMLGEVKLFAGNFAPKGWAFCKGQLLPIADNQALFSIIGTIYGGDGRTTFALPDLRGRVAVGDGSGPGLTNRNLGAKGGMEERALTNANLPQGEIRVPAFAITNNDNFEPIKGNKSVISIGDAANSVVPLSIGGRAEPVPSMQPFQVLNYIICTKGSFPSRQ